MRYLFISFLLFLTATSQPSAAYPPNTNVTILDAIRLNQVVRLGHPTAHVVSLIGEPDQIEHLVSDFTGVAFIQHVYGSSHLYYMGGYLRSFYLASESIQLSIGTATLVVGTTTAVDIQQSFPASWQQRISNPDGTQNVWIAMGYFESGQIRLTDESIYIQLDSAGIVREIIYATVDE